jgi:hypothetical protein
MVSFVDGLTIVNGVLAVAGVGSMAGVITLVRKSGAIEEGRNRDIKEIRASIETIQHDIGNGAFNGIKQNIQEMQITCAGAMADVQARVTNLEADMKGKIPNPFHQKPE